MTEHDHPIDILREMEAIERTASSFYHSAAERFSNDVEASALFFQMALEEVSHAELVSRYWLSGFQGDLNRRQLGKETRIMAEELAALRRAIHSPSGPGLLNTVAASWFLEVKLGEVYLLSELAERWPAFAELLKDLVDPEHSKKLWAFAVTRGMTGDLQEALRSLDGRTEAMSTLHPRVVPSRSTLPGCGR